MRVANVVVLALVVFVSLAWLSVPAAGSENKPSDWDVSCADQRSCTDVDCSPRQYARRSGQLCNSWPFYNGRYPMESIEFDDESEFYDCTATTGLNSSVSYCSTWTTTEIGKGETETGSCNCRQGGNGYCHVWRCIQREEDVCGGYQDGDSCCYEDSEGDTYCVPFESELEFTTCTCTVTRPRSDAPGGGASMCTEWTCIETDNDGGAAKEAEFYECVVLGAARCESWLGSTNSIEEFEFSRAECVTSDCSSWRAFERGVQYHYPRLTWALLPNLLGGFVLLMAIYWMYSRTAPVLAVGAVIVYLALLIITVWKAGLIAMLLGLIPLGCILLIDLCVCWQNSKMSLLGRLFPDACMSSASALKSPANGVPMVSVHELRPAAGPASVGSTCVSVCSAIETSADETNTTASSDASDSGACSSPPAYDGLRRSQPTNEKPPAYS